MITHRIILNLHYIQTLFFSNERQMKWLGSYRITILLCLFALLTGNVQVFAQDVFIPEGNPDITLEGMLMGSAGIAVDHDGNVFVADTLNHVVRKYFPDGAPLTVLGREFVSGNSDGPPVDVRFNLPFRLAIASDGDILVTDSNSRIRRIDQNTLNTTTIADLSSGVDGHQIYHLYTGQTVNEGELLNLQIGDIAVRANGDIFVTAADQLGVQLYLVRIHNGIKTAIATSKLVAPQTGKFARGVAIDRLGNVFAQFPGEAVSGFHPDNIYRFPDGGNVNVTVHYKSISFNRTMASSLSDRLYLASGLAADPIEIISSSQHDTLIGQINVTQTFPQLPSQEIHDITVGPQGSVYAVNDRSVDGNGVPTPPVAKVDRFPNYDVAIGAQTGDIELPKGTLISPIEGQLVTTSVPLQANASDNSGQVQVQFYVDDKSFAPILTTPPFASTLNPAILPDGNHQIYAMLRDATGNAQATTPVLIRTEGGLPNTDGEIFVADIPLNQPIGSITDGQGNVYVADQTRILKYSPLGKLSTIYGSMTSGFQDGSPEQARFANLKGLGKDHLGNILIVDDSDSDSPLIRSLNPMTDQTTTLLALDETANIDVSNVYNVTTHTYEDLIASNPLCAFIPCDFAVAEAYDVQGLPNGDMLVGAARSLAPEIDPFHYVLYLSPTGNRALARATVTYGQIDSDKRVATS